MDLTRYTGQGRAWTGDTVVAAALPREALQRIVEPAIQQVLISQEHQVDPAPRHPFRVPAWTRSLASRSLAWREITFVGLAATVADFTEWQHSGYAANHVAAQALMQFGPDYVRRAIFGIARETSPLSELDKLDAVSYFGDTAVQALTELATDLKSSDGTRIFAIKALLQLDSQTSVQSIKALLDEKSPSRIFVAIHVSCLASVLASRSSGDQFYYQRAHEEGVIHLAQAWHAVELLRRFCAESDAHKRFLIVAEANHFLVGPTRLPNWQRLIRDLQRRETNIGMDQEVLSALGRILDFGNRTHTISDGRLPPLTI